MDELDLAKFDVFLHAPLGVTIHRAAQICLAMRAKHGRRISGFVFNDQVVYFSEESTADSLCTNYLTNRAAKP